MGVPESVGRSGVVVGPGLSALSVGEISIGAADCNIQNKVEVTVEGSIVRFVNPWVINGKSTLFPKTLA